MFNGILIEKDEQGYRASVQALTQADLPQGDVLVKVDYSTLNYKDALAITGKGPIVRSFPMVPGIDFAGVAEQSEHADFTPGQRVILNGWGVGEQHWGGLAQYARVKADCCGCAMGGMVACMIGPRRSWARADRKDASMLVATGPGATALQRTPFGV